eukprot:m.36357 g.36357  ORF g.36357 m.36357 type:complete len:329 (+) comp11406_c0_seq1:229-1215(+)
MDRLLDRRNRNLRQVQQRYTRTLSSDGRVHGCEGNAKGLQRAERVLEVEVELGLVDAAKLDDRTRRARGLLLGGLLVLGVRRIHHQLEVLDRGLGRAAVEVQREHHQLLVPDRPGVHQVQKLVVDLVKLGSAVHESRILQVLQRAAEGTIRGSLGVGLRNGDNLLTQRDVAAAQSRVPDVRQLPAQRLVGQIGLGGRLCAAVVELELVHAKVGLDLAENLGLLLAVGNVRLHALANALAPSDKAEHLVALDHHIHGDMVLYTHKLALVDEAFGQRIEEKLAHLLVSHVGENVVHDAGPAGEEVRLNVISVDLALLLQLVRHRGLCEVV